MHIMSWNVNGIRAIERSQSHLWITKERPDILCLQETKAQECQIPRTLLDIHGYNAYFHSAEKKGYSGVAVYTKNKPQRVRHTLGLSRFDKEGRLLELHFRDFTLLNLYIPHGGRKKENLVYKLETYKRLLKRLKSYEKKNIILAGDFNIAHHDIDLARPQHNRKNIMFTPKERGQIDKLQDVGFVDTFRNSNPKKQQFSWWPYFANARERNIGWRIDYLFASQAFLPRLEDAYIRNDITGSDHCPVGIKLRTKK